jgi:hypothetical protein
MDSWLTMIGSIAIGGIFLLGVLGFYGDVVNHSSEKTIELITQETMVGLMEVIEHDFERMGSGLTPPAAAILSMDSTSITFQGDIDGNPGIDQVAYTISNTAASTENPDDVILFRTVNGVNTIDMPIGVTLFRLRYYSVAGDETTNPNDVRLLGIQLGVESTFSLTDSDSTFARAFWQQRISPKNLQQMTTYDSGA